MLLLAFKQQRKLSQIIISVSRNRRIWINRNLSTCCRYVRHSHTCQTVVEIRIAKWKWILVFRFLSFILFGFTRTSALRLNVEPHVRILKRWKPTHFVWRYLLDLFLFSKLFFPALFVARSNADVCSCPTPFIPKLYAGISMIGSTTLWHIQCMWIQLAVLFRWKSGCFRLSDERQCDEWHNMWSLMTACHARRNN